MSIRRAPTKAVLAPPAALKASRLAGALDIGTHQNVAQRTLSIARILTEHNFHNEKNSSTEDFLVSVNTFFDSLSEGMQQEFMMLTGLHVLLPETWEQWLRQVLTGTHVLRPETRNQWLRQVHEEYKSIINSWDKVRVIDYNTSSEDTIPAVARALATVEA